MPIKKKQTKENGRANGQTGFRLNLCISPPFPVSSLLFSSLLSLLKQKPSNYKRTCGYWIVNNHNGPKRSYRVCEACIWGQGNPFFIPEVINSKKNCLPFFDFMETGLRNNTSQGCLSPTLPSSSGGLMALVEYIFLCCILHKKHTRCPLNEVQNQNLSYWFQIYI